MSFVSFTSLSHKSKEEIFQTGNWDKNSILPFEGLLRIKEYNTLKENKIDDFSPKQRKSEARIRRKLVYCIILSNTKSPPKALVNSGRKIYECIHTNGSHESISSYRK